MKYSKAFSQVSVDDVMTWGRGSLEFPKKVLTILMDSPYT